MTHHRLLIATAGGSGTVGYGFLRGSASGHGTVFTGPDWGMLFGFVLILVAMICTTIVICAYLKSKRP